MKNAAQYKSLGAYGTIGIEIVLCILFGWWIGTKLDDRLGTTPWMAVAWFAFGCAAAGKALHRAWKQMQAAAKREEAEEGNPAQQFPDEKALEWQREEEKARETSKKGAREVENGAEGATDQAEKRDG
jgi:ATP synthase protein I